MAENTEEANTMGQTANEDHFDWDKYLKETGSISAPSEYFRQSKTPPTNEFKIGMKLEARDPRNIDSVCVASVIGITGARLRLRLDGSDNKNDFWRLVDSSDIQPVGTCEQGGDLLQPPLGYTLNTSSWPMFLLRVLTGNTSSPKKGITIKIVLPKKKGGKSGKKEKSIPVISSTSSASLSTLMKSSSSNKTSAGPSKIVMSTVCVYINKHGDCGPFLDPQKVQQLPNHFGPGPVNVILQRTVQACVNCAFQAKDVFLFLKTDNRGGEMITAFFDGKVHTVQLPPVNSASFALRFLENFCQSLQCDNFLSSQPFRREAQVPTPDTGTDQSKPENGEPKEKRSLKRLSLHPHRSAPVSSKVPRKSGQASKGN